MCVCIRAISEKEENKKCVGEKEERASERMNEKEREMRRNVCYMRERLNLIN